jgi:hypothetical protein
VRRPYEPPLSESRGCERVIRQDEMPALDEREAARLGRVDACFRQGDAGIWVRPHQVSALVHGEHVVW